MNEHRDWTPQENEILKRRWNVDCWSASQIGREIGRTRNSVIGRVHRMKLKPRKTLIRAKPKLKPYVRRGRTYGFNTAPRLVRVLPSIPKATECHPAPPTILITLMELGPHDCRWPTGEGVEGRTTYAFCGLKCDDGESFCEAHAHRAYKRLRKSKDQRPTRRGLAA